jgi:hypothetical protein
LRRMLPPIMPPPIALGPIMPPPIIPLAPGDPPGADQGCAPQQVCQP